MAEAAPVVHIGENSPEQIAYKLFDHIVRVERQDLYPDRGEQGATRKWILDTYAECLLAVKAPGHRPE
jgi:hypothetical protein